MGAIGAGLPPSGSDRGLVVGLGAVFCGELFDSPVGFSGFARGPMGS